MLFGNKVKPEDFEAAALPHLNELFRAAIYHTGSRVEAEDLVQEVYLQAWKSFHRFKLGTNCRAWLYKILLNKSLRNKEHRRRERFRFVVDSDKALEKITYEPPVPEHLDDEEILLCLQKIPEHYRVVIVLADVQEFSYKETADILAIRVGTVMSRLSRGRKLLRVELAQVAPYYGIMTVNSD